MSAQIRTETKENSFITNETMTHFDPEKETPFMKAVYKDDLETVEFLLNDPNININAPGALGWTPLTVALTRKLENMCNYLSRRADLNALDKFSKTALMHAASDNYVNGVKWLLARGADCNRQSDKGLTALMCACRNNAQECIDILLKHGADINLKDIAGTTAIMHAVYEQEKLDYYQNKIVPGRVPGRASMSILLLIKNSGVDVNWDAIDNKGNSALFYGALTRQAETVRFLATQGCDHEIINNNGWTPLMVAIYFRQKSLSMMLVNTYSSKMLAHQSKDNYTAKRLAEQIQAIKKDSDFVQMLNNRFASDQLHDAAKNGRTNQIAVLLNNGAMLFGFLPFRMTPLMWASLQNHPECVAELLKINPEKQVLSRDYKNRCALHHAALRGNFKVIPHLLQYCPKEQLETKDVEGFTPIMRAIWFGLKTGIFESVIQLLNVNDRSLIYSQLSARNKNTGESLFMWSLRHAKSPKNFAYFLLSELMLQCLEYPKPKMYDKVKHQKPMIASINEVESAALLQETKNLSSLLLQSDNNGNIPLLLAVKEGNIRWVRWCLTCAPQRQLSHQNKEGLTALMLAADNHDEYILQLLLPDKAFPGLLVKDNLGHTLFHRFACQGTYSYQIRNHVLCLRDQTETKANENAMQDINVFDSKEPKPKDPKAEASSTTEPPAELLTHYKNLQDEIAQVTLYAMNVGNNPSYLVQKKDKPVKQEEQVKKEEPIKIEGQVQGKIDDQVLGNSSGVAKMDLSS